MRRALNDARRNVLRQLFKMWYIHDNFLCVGMSNNPILWLTCQTFKEFNESLISDSAKQKQLNSVK